jgi:2-dehydropantoate 2-reductase
MSERKMSMSGQCSYRPKRFGVIGAGPVGAIVAAFLARGGYEVTLCDVVPALLEPAMNPGVLLEGSDNFQARVARVTTRVDDLVLDPPDVIFITVKATALPLITSALEGFVGEGRYVVSWQNGIDTELVLSQVLGRTPVMRAVVNFGSVLVKPGHIRLAFHHRPHYIQELDPDSREAAIGISQVLTACGLDTFHTDQIRNMVWSKAVNNSCMNPVCAVTGKTMAEVINDPILFGLVDSLLKEGITVARANEMSLGPDFYPDCINYIKTAGHHKPSMLQDIEAGRPTEVDYINGKIIEYGLRAGMAAPYNSTLRSLVKALETR